MKIMDAVKNYLDVFDMATSIEQYSLNKESRLFMTLPELKPPYPLSATVTFSYDAQQTSYSLMSSDEEDNEDEELENMIEVDVAISLPYLEGYNKIHELFEEIANNYPELDPMLIKKEFFKRDMINGEEYEIVYSYFIGGEELKDNQIYEDMFIELTNILRSIYNKTKFLIEMSWDREHEEDSF
jgi:hypothetical protein